MSPAPRRYFDHAASSPMNDACRAALEACDAQGWRGANPNSLHSSGRRAFEALEDARLRLARALGCRRPSEVVLTSGGTESNNLAVRGIALAVAERRPGRRRVLVSSLEHDSVLDAAESLVREARSASSASRRRARAPSTSRRSRACSRTTSPW